MADTQLRLDSGPLSLITNGPQSAAVAIVLGHGAGADIRSDFMEFFAQGLAGQGRAVVRFNFPYMEAGKKAPDRQPLLEEAFAAVALHAAEVWPKAKLVLGGKSLGGRIASHVVASGVPADGLVFLGYPLHPPGRPDRIRDEHLAGVSTPMLFVEGTRDPFCPLATLEGVRAKLKAPTTVHVVDDGDHSLKVRKSSGRSTEEAWREAITAIVEWLATL